MSGGGLWLGLDIGTQSARALVADEGGAILAAASAPLSGRRDGARHEQRPEEWWRAVAGACRAVTAEVDADAIGGLACDGTSGTVVLVDAAGDPLTPGLMYDDARAEQEAERVNEAGADVWRSLGYRMQASWALPKLVWLLGHGEPPPAGARLEHQVDFVTRRLAGEPAPTDWSSALKTGYDLVEERWPHAVMEALGVPAELLPEVRRSGAPIGAVCAAGAAATGLRAGTPVIAGMTDGCAAQLGAGALEPGGWNTVLGTTLVFKGVTEELVRDPAGVVYSHRAPEHGWLPGGASSVGAGVLTTRFPGADLAQLGERAAERGPVPVVAYPLASRGERFPFVAPHAEGFELGSPEDEVEGFAALLQGVAFVERLGFDYLDHLGAPTGGELRSTGGGTRSPYWNALRADVLGRPLALPEQSEAALGMAVLAAAHERPLADVARAMVRVGEVVEPRPERGERLRELYVELVDELERRGWLPADAARHAHARAGA